MAPASHLALALATIAFATALVGASGAPSGASAALPPSGEISGLNPHPVTLVRPAERPLSALARIGRQIFFDASLSASGKQSCASCHSPEHSYGPPDGLPVQPGGPHMTGQGFRPPPSLAYLYRQEVFGIGPSADDEDAPAPLDQVARQAQARARGVKTAGVSSAAAPVPHGGLFWDGRADTLADQAAGPMMNAAEMGNSDVHDVIRRLALTKYRDEFRPLFGRTIVDNPDLLFAEAMSSVARFQIEDASFHRFDSKYDHWLEGRARLTPAEMRGMRIFNDSAKGNCAACHISQPDPDGLPPLFTDSEYEALGVPRNRVITANRDPRFFDMGLCGPLRSDLARQTQYCGMFRTPSLRNAANRGVYFHNGVYHSLRQVLDFYNLRDTDPARIYPRDRTQKVSRYDDLPARYYGNVDVADAPFGRRQGERPPLNDAEIDDIIAFIRSLSDGDRSTSS